MKSFNIVAGVVSSILTVAAVTTAASAVNAPAASAAPGGFLVTADVPTLTDLHDQVVYLIETPGVSDEAKAANMEGGMGAVPVADALYNTGLFRAPYGSNEITGPETQDGDIHTAMLRTKSVGRPDITARVVWKRIDGVWKLANSSVCEGIQAVGLSMSCNF
ncbi:hypothetical protein [Nocardia sp. NBC_00511]|uniref:hypothetical protein n=1 Tax=Nocardia sp. NBC_00511 TaxID=2903591 RepID=UPI0030E2BAF7